MTWIRGDTLEVKLKDETNKTIYKSKVNVVDIKRLSLMMSSLQSLGVKIIESVGDMINETDKDEKDSGWFS